MNTMSERITQLMKTYNISQKQLAKNAGVTEAAISRYLSGEREPKAEILANIATALHTTSDYLLTGKEKSSFDEIYTLVARGLSDMTEEEKLEIMRLVVNATKR